LDWIPLQGVQQHLQSGCGTTTTAAPEGAKNTTTKTNFTGTWKFKKFDSATNKALVCGYFKGVSITSEIINQCSNILSGIGSGAATVVISQADDEFDILDGSVRNKFTAALSQASASLEPYTIAFNGKEVPEMEVSNLKCETFWDPTGELFTHCQGPHISIAKYPRALRRIRGDGIMEYIIQSHPGDDKEVPPLAPQQLIFEYECTDNCATQPVKEKCSTPSGGCPEVSPVGVCTTDTLSGCSYVKKDDPDHLEWNKDKTMCCVPQCTKEESCSNVETSGVLGGEHASTSIGVALLFSIAFVC